MHVDKKQFRDIFEETKLRYEELQDTEIELKFGNGWFFTMRAGIKLWSIFMNKRTYRVHVNLSRKDVLTHLSKNDVMGWFGHELAHIVEYEKMDSLALVRFTLQYIFDPGFRLSVERRVNVFAYNNGFAEELFGVWKKFLSMNGISASYKKYIEKYHPHWEEVRESAENRGITKEMYESFE